MGKKVLLPKQTCCVSATRCDRCPIRMLQEGTLPAGYGVHKRKLVRLDANGKRIKTRKVKKAELAAAVRLQRKAAKTRKQKSGKKKQHAA